MLPFKITAIFSTVFAGMCLWFAIDGFMSPAELADTEQVSGGRSFALFWAFLAVVGCVIAWVTWKIAQAQAKDEDS